MAAKARRVTYGDVAGARAVQDRTQNLGLSPDVLRAQRTRDNPAADDTAPSTQPEPAGLPALPSPEHAAPGAGYTVDRYGVVRPATYGDIAGTRVAQKRSQDLGLSPDVLRAQRMRDQPPTDEAAQTARPEPATARTPLESARTEAATTPSTAAPEAQPPAEAEPAVLQNRDRSTAAAIQQMNTIAANPDPNRLGFSRDFANGAPVVEANPSMDIPAGQLGRQDVSVAADGRQIPVQYAVVEADTLLPSNRADGTTVAGYEKGQPDMLRAIAGNGRVAGLQAAYDRGTTAGYRAGIAQDAALTGIPARTIENMKQPVLVRMMPRDQVTRDIGDVSNTSGTAALSAVEQAHNDAARIDMDALDFDDNGEPSPESVRAFVRSMPVSEQVGLLNPDGSPTPQAVDRLMAATFARAYHDPELVRLYAQATDPEARTVLGGMATAAGSMSRLDGMGDFDIRAAVTDAAKLAVNARRQGVKLNEFAKQGDMAMSPDTQEIVRLFAENSRSAKKIGEALQRVADFAYSEASKPNEDMFGPVERAGRSQILEKLNDATRPQDMAIASGREPSAQTVEGQTTRRAGPADREPAETVGTARPRDAGGKRAEAGRRPQAVKEEPAASEEPLLTQPTPDELRERDARQRQVQQDEQKRIDEAEKRAKADAERGDFRLTGSDRDADVAAAHGQKAMFSRTRKKAAEPDVPELMLTHNLSARNLMHALRMGGIPVPSLAVTRKQHTPTGFGEISLLGSRELADPKGAARTRVFGADIYSPRYPSVEHHFKPGALDRLRKEFDAAREMTADRELDASEVQRQGTEEFERRPQVMARFLMDKGVKPDIAMKEGISPQRVERLKRQGFEPHFGKTDYLAMKRDPAFQKLALEARKADYTDADMPDRAKRLEAQTRENPDWLAEDYAREMAKIGARPEPDRYATETALQKQIDKAGLTGEYQDYNHNVQVYDTVDDLPAHLQKQAKAEGANDVEGVFDPKTGQVALIAGNIDTPERAREVARHELIGHYGLENMVGSKLMDDLAKKVIAGENAGNSTFRKIGAEVDARQAGLSAERRGREMVAMMAERNMQNSFARRVLDAVRTFLRKIGLTKGDLSDAEVAKLLRDTQVYLRDRGRSIAEPVDRTARAMFSRPAPAIKTVPGTSIPRVERQQTLRERIQDIRANPKFAARSAARNTARMATKGGEAPQPKALENFVTNFFDHRNPLVQLVRRSGNTAAGKDFIHTMRMFEAKTQKNIADFEHEHVTPMMKTLADAWKTKYKDMPYYREHGYQQFLEDIGSVGNYVKHGKERNKVIAEKTQGNDLAGSGRTDEQIDAIQRDLAKHAPGLEQFYEKLYRDHLKPMLDHRDKVLRDSGLLTPAMEKARPDYKWYLPLTGDPDETEDALSRSASVSLKSPKAKQATGREGTLSQNALHNVLERTDVAMRRAGMQDFKRDFVRLLESSPQAKELAHAKINDGHANEIYEKYIGDDGMIHRRVKANASMSPDALVLHDGDPYMHLWSKQERRRSSAALSPSAAPGGTVTPIQIHMDSMLSGIGKDEPMKQQNAVQKENHPDEALTVDEKYKKLAMATLQRGAQMSARFRSIRILLDDLHRRPAITPADQERADAILSVMRKSVEVYENQAEDFVHFSTVICMNANGYSFPDKDLAESLQLMADPKMPIKRPGLPAYVRCRGAKNATADANASRALTRVRRPKRKTKAAATQ